LAHSLPSFGPSGTTTPGAGLPERRACPSAAHWRCGAGREAASATAAAATAALLLLLLLPRLLLLAAAAAKAAAKAAAAKAAAAVAGNLLLLWDQAERWPGNRAAAQR
jgi:hypothetical protein